MNERKLLDQVRDKIRLKHYSIKTEQSYVSWTKCYIFFHHLCHPNEMGKDEIEQFLTFLAVQKKVSPTTQNQAFFQTLLCYPSFTSENGFTFYSGTLGTQKR